MAEIEAASLLMIVVLGAILGTVGQLVRVVVGLKKMQDKYGPAWIEKFDLVRLVSSLIVALAVGSTAGVLYILNIPMDDGVLLLSQDSWMAVVAAGYAGTDFIEGFIKRAGTSDDEEEEEEEEDEQTPLTSSP